MGLARFTANVGAITYLGAFDDVVAAGKTAGGVVLTVEVAGQGSAVETYACTVGAPEVCTVTHLGAFDDVVTAARASGVIETTKTVEERKKVRQINISVTFVVEQAARLGNRSRSETNLKFRIVFEIETI